jgi:hypothetical protein
MAMFTVRPVSSESRWSCGAATSRKGIEVTAAKPRSTGQMS